MRILITGAGGFIGSHLARKLQTDGHDVRGTFFQPTIGIDEIARAPGTLQEVDVRDFGHVYLAMKYTLPDVIFHLAAQSYPTRSIIEPDLTIETNVVGTINLLEAIRDTSAIMEKFDPRVIVTGTPKLV